MIIPVSFLLRRLGRPALVLALLLPTLLFAQDGGPGTGGLTRLEQDRLLLANGHRVLVIGAHPDDEDTELITILSRGMGVETAYLSLTRGEGGQNLIGGELGAALGIVRSEELLAARRVDGGRQFFTRAIDFGFSKSAEETLEIWPRDSILADIVRVIRRYRPHLIVSVWSGTPADGHGHHQASGMLAREAFDAAQDPARFPMPGLAPWRPLKFYRDYRATGPGATFEGGRLDPVTGHSFRQLAARSRSQHRSQDMGSLEEVGPSSRRIVLEAVASGLDLAADTALLAGLPAQPIPDPERLARVRLAELGVIVDAYTDDDEVTPGQSVSITTLVWNTGVDTIAASISWPPRDGWEMAGEHDCGVRVLVAPGAVHRCILPVAVAAQARPGQPYFLVNAAEPGSYTLSGPSATWGEPFDRPVEVSFRISPASGAPPVSVRHEVTARSLDQARGEMRDPVTIVPRVMLDVSPGRLLWRRGLAQRPFVVTVEHAGIDSTIGTVRLRLPSGWRGGDPQPVAFANQGERATLTFAVVPPPNVTAGEVELVAEAIVDADTMRLGVRRVRYPHIRERLIFHLAGSSVVVAPVRFADGRRIGYVRGAADAIPEALGAAGVPVTVLDLDRLPAALLDSLDVVVIGPRAYEINNTLRRLHPRLLEWARAGGTLIIQYQQYQYVEGGFPPLPLTIGRPHDRVTDEQAQVTQLMPRHPAVRTPNLIEAADFDGWIQERGLYFARSWDPAWQELLEMSDPGEAARRGSLLIAPFGKGTVVYTGLAFFRQLPAAVPGAWKLFANLLALGGNGS